MKYNPECIQFTQTFIWRELLCAMDQLGRVWTCENIYEGWRLIQEEKEEEE
jgi:hypothetical protein